jgi:hypothetical protein
MVRDGTSFLVAHDRLKNLQLPKETSEAWQRPSHPGLMTRAADGDSESTWLTLF